MTTAVHRDRSAGPQLSAASLTRRLLTSDHPEELLLILVERLKHGGEGVIVGIQRRSGGASGRSGGATSVAAFGDDVISRLTRLPDDVASLGRNEMLLNRMPLLAEEALDRIIIDDVVILRNDADVEAAAGRPLGSWRMGKEIRLTSSALLFV